MCLAAFVAGAALVAAFSPADVYPLGVLAPALLIHLWLRAAGPRDCALIGFSFGMGLFCAGVSWVYVSLSVFGGMPAAIAGFATLAYCAWLALLPAAVGYAQYRLTSGDTARSLAAIPAIWMLAEWLRGWYFTGFPWLVLGYAASDTPLAGYAPLVGVYGISLIAMFCAGLLRMVWVGTHRTACVALITAILCAGALLRTVEWTAPYGDPIEVSLLQGNIAQEMKFNPERYAKTLATYERLAEESHAKLIVLPETALPRFVDRIDPAYLDRLESIARRNGGDLLVGVPYRAGESEAAKYYNSVISLGLAPRQLYSKVHLVPFGEFVPPGFGWIVNVLRIPLSDFSRGDATQAPLAVAGQQVAVNICYEDAFGEEIIRQLPQATLLVNVSNMAWFGDSLAPGQHLQMARMRSIETGRTLLAATNSGVTAAIDRDGRVLAQLAQFTEGRLDAKVSGYSGATPYVHSGNWPALLAAFLLLALSAAMRKR